LRFLLRQMAITRQTTITGRLLQLGTRRINKIKNRFKTPSWFMERITSYHHTGTTMPLSLVVEGKFYLRTLCKKPLCQKANSLRRPMDLLLNQIDGVRKTDRNLRSLFNPRFALAGHGQGL